MAAARSIPVTDLPAGRSHAIQADTIEKIILTAKENQVETVLIPSDTKDTIRSLQLSFQIKAKQGKVLKEHVQFRFTVISKAMYRNGAIRRIPGG